MAKSLRVTNRNELEEVNNLIHDCYFDVAEIEFDATTLVLSFRFLCPSDTRKFWWRDFFSTSKMRPAIECFLRIGNVESYSIDDKQKVGTYDFNVLDYESSTATLTVRTGIPIGIEIHVRTLDVLVEMTDNVIEEPGHSKQGWLGGTVDKD